MAEDSNFRRDFLYFKNNVQNKSGCKLEEALRQYILFLENSIAKSSSAVDKYYIMQEKLKYEKKLIKLQGEMDVEMEEAEIEISPPITIEEMQNDDRFTHFFDKQHIYNFDIPQPAVRQSSDTLMRQLRHQFKNNVTFSVPNPIQAPNPVVNQYALKPRGDSRVLGKRTSYDNNPRKKRLTNPVQEQEQSAFMSAKAKLRQDDIEKGRNPNRFPNNGGARRRGPGLSRSNAPGFVKRALQDEKMEDDVPEPLRQIDPKLRESIESEILNDCKKVTFDDIAGLLKEKKEIERLLIWPMKAPALFTGPRRAAKGILLFGPPGTGKTMIGRAVASEVNAKFFNISAASLTSKWHGESEKLVRAMFLMARYYQPSIIFIDEIDSLLAKRKDKDDDANRRVKTEFLVQLDGCGTSDDDLVYIIGATNRPQELDEAARRRLSKRLYIPLPCVISRTAMIEKILQDVAHVMGPNDIASIAEKTEGYSGADISFLCNEAIQIPIIDAAQGVDDVSKIKLEEIRGVHRNDFLRSLRKVTPSVKSEEIEHYM